MNYLWLVLVFCEFIRYEASSINRNPCGGMADGDFPLRDVFQFLACRHNEAKIVDCHEHKIFDPEEQKCIPLKKYDKDTFCAHRSTSNWRDPWNCHGYISCVNKQEVMMSCASSSSQLVYNPELDACVNSDEYLCREEPSYVRFDSKKISDNPCTGLSNGQYPIRDVFKYMVCTDGAASYVECDNGLIYEPGVRRCIQFKLESLLRFCENRDDGNWVNPWNCHRFLGCKDHLTTDVPCALDYLNYDPYLDACVLNDKYPCHQVSEENVTSTKAVVNDANPCEHLPDGDYAIRDVFEYMTCKASETTYTSCPQNNIYEAKERKCVDISTQTKDSFCKDRSDGDWANPWDCHQFFKCFRGITYEYKCQLSNLHYDPYKDQCVYPEEYECKQVTKLETLSSLNDNACSGKTDGNYPLPDVFKYLICKGGKASDGSCSDKEIFDPASSSCVHTDYQSLDKFCVSRSDGDWRNPWNCYGYLLCKKHTTYVKPCFLNGFIFNPYADLCEIAFPCKTIYGVEDEKDFRKESSVTTTAQSSLTIKDICTTLPDGQYAPRNVSQILVCKNHKSSIRECPKNQIYFPGNENCTDLNDVVKDKFCANRTDGNWLDPWNSHSYFTCSNGYQFLRNCPASLIYEPIDDKCEHDDNENYYIHKKDNVFDANPCEHLPDGDYAIRDVFEYMTCKASETTYTSCPQNNIYEAKERKCVDISTQTKDSFCKDRSDGDWANPWDCHQFFKCFRGITYEYKCQLSNLHYDPYKDQCVYPEEYECKQVAKLETLPSLNDNACSGKTDGNYPLPDVFKYLICKGGKASDGSCSDKEIFDPASSSCVHTDYQSLDKFCVSRSDGDWRNPWNCYGYLLCKKHTTYVKPCFLNGFIFNPYADLCEIAFPCKTIYGVEDEKDITVRRTQLEDKTRRKFTRDDLELHEFCSDKPNGKYAIRDVFSYIKCRKQVGTLVKCGRNQMFDVISLECDDGASYTKETFCLGRSTGHYRNPWDCYSFVSCVSEVYIEQKCPSKLVYDPYSNQCDYSSEVKCQILNTLPCSYTCPGCTDIKHRCDLCKDGVYPIRDVFQYLSCKSFKGTVMSCDKDKIFLPDVNNEGSGKCVPASSINKDNFCNSRTKCHSNWKNPWRCNKFLACVGVVLFNLKCPIRTLVYYPDKNECVYNISQYNCTVVKAYRNFCDSRIKCKSCWRDPWNCHRRILCGPNFPMMIEKCEAKSLVYNPPPNTCVASAVFPCVTVKQSSSVTTTTQSSLTIKDICTTLPDGQYAPRNVSQILVCKNHKSSIRECPKNQIYFPGNENCTDLNDVVKDKFCANRTDGNWLNPWDSHSYFTCSNGYQFSRNCPASLIYEPVDDKCEHDDNDEDYDRPEKGDAVKLSSAVQTSDGNEDPCTHLPDGTYAIRDVLSYMLCRAHKSTIMACEDGLIYVAGTLKCTPAKDVSLANFCNDRPDGNWQNPWNCHHYITCHVGHVFDRECSTKTTLNYNPYLDLCAFPYQYTCKQLDSEGGAVSSSENPCEGRKDGQYPVRDVFKYLTCKKNTAKYASCPDNQYYSASSKKCVEGKKVLDTFCLGRSTGNWRNPWDCHGYITCVGKTSFERPCSKLTVLNYDPDNDLCEYPTKFPCKQLTESNDVLVEEGFIEIINF